MTAVRPGTELGGRYRLVRLRGRGGMGEVWEAEDPVLERQVAVKVVDGARGHDRSLLDRFEREARTSARLMHPHLATVYDYGEFDGGLFLVMELLEGETLAERLREGPLPPEEAAGAAADAADALGAVLFESLTGQRAFGGATPSETALAHLHAPTPDVAEVDPALSGPLAQVCQDMLAREPARRPSAAEVAFRLRHLDRAAAAAPTEAAPADATSVIPVAAPVATPEPGPDRPTPSRSSNNATRTAVIVLLVLMAVLGVVLGVLLTRDDDGGADGGGEAARTTQATTVDEEAAATAPPATAPPATAAPATSPPDDAPASGDTPPASGDLATAATDYIAALDAGDFGGAWARTTPEFRAAQDRQSWEGFWGSYDSLAVVGEPQVDEASGTVVLPIDFDGSTEDYRLTLAPGPNGSWLVSGPVGD